MKNSYYHIGGIFFGLMLTTVSINSKAQTRSISGTVTSSNKPLSGVIISQEGSDQVTMTANNGTYTIKVSAENPILLFRHPDYAEERFTITNQSVVNISLEQKVKGIEEVILNAGYYKVKDRESTGSIAKVSAKDIENQPVGNVLSAVQGRMPGVSITQNSGTAGGGYDIQIRGRNSLRTLQNSGTDGNQPLYVIDGVPIGSAITSNYSATVIPFKSINPLNNINPNDIESIEVLKDADATAIYGSRGANGVILVTTKKGRKGSLSVLLNANYGISRVASQMEMMDTEQYLTMRRQAYNNAGVTTYPVTAYDVNGKWNQNRYTDWQKELIGNWADLRTVQISVSGGGERSSFLISAQNSEQTTVFPADFGYKTNLLNSNFMYQSEDRKFNLTSSNSFAALSNNVVQSDLTNQSLNLSPVAPALYDAFGNLNWEDNTFTNPLASLYGSYKNKTYQFNQNLNLGYEFIEGLSLKLNAGINYQTLEEYLLKPHTMSNPSFGRTSNDSSTSRSKNDIFTYIVEPQANYLKSWGQHELNVLIGSSFQQTVNKSTSMVGVGFASNALMQNLSAATIKTFPQDSRNEYRYASLFGRVNYQYKNRYILNLTARRDGSSRFGENNRFANFGAVGAAWLFSRESFLKENKWLSFGKLRASIGTTGSDFIGDYQYLDSYTVSGSPYNGNIGLYPSRLYNPNFSWEKTTKFEAGLELGFLKDRISLTTAYYRNRSTNQLVGVPLPGTTGFTSIQANLDATVQNTGWEFQLNASPIKSSDWKWQTSFNISIPDTKLMSFPDLEGSTYANSYVVGMPTNIVKLYNYEGINPQTGQYVFTDYNRDGKITSPDDAQAIRELGTKYFGGWQNDVKFKNISFSFLFQFVKQNNWNYYRNMANPGTLINMPVEFINVWSPDNLEGVIMPYDPGTTALNNTLTNNLRNSTATVSDASFIRLKNVQVNYAIPLKSNVVKEAIFYVQGQNLWTLTKYFGLDPEFVLAGYLPPLKTYSFGVQLKF
ncbi:SusC/RagA family TonB-linked outer membrane protein [Chryseobacterium sp. GP-SGM7]|uniref:SusC/RagA family TonB-linked outer membrane protein n=1 Tax=Chryseobacterium sp. GP-SGM7 TaxID=3411323 RepID=UPI003B95CA67